MSRKSKILKWNDWIVFITLSLIWGTSFILIKKSLKAFDSTQVASLRILIATIAFTPVVLFNFKKIDWSKWYLFLIVGLAGGGIPPFLFAMAQTKINSGLAGALNTLTPIFTLLVAVIFFKNKIDNRKFSGVLIGLVGAGLLIYLTNSSFEGGLMYSSLIILATILYALNANMVKKFFDNHDPLILTAVSFIVFGPITIIILANGDFIDVMRTDSNAYLSLGAVTLLSLMSTVFATVLFFKLVQKSSTIFATSVSYTVPFVAVIWGVLDGEQYKWYHMLSMVAIILGVYLIRPVSSGLPKK